MHNNREYCTTIMCVQYLFRTNSLAICNMYCNDYCYDYCYDYLILGPDGPLLLQSLQLFSTGHKGSALALLQRREVLQNCTTAGGANPMRSYILSRINTDS